MICLYNYEHRKKLLGIGIAAGCELRVARCGFFTASGVSDNVEFSVTL